MGKIYTDVYNIKHDNCTIVNTLHSFQRIFIIEDAHGSRFTCLKDDPPMLNKSNTHWKHASPRDAPEDYAVPYNKRN